MEKSIIANTKNYNATLDIAKLIFALLVVAIHTEPFGFSFLLDKGLGMITRLCVPFFFVTSSFLFFKKDSEPLKYVKRIFVLYLVWCLLYLSINFESIMGMSLPKLIVHYFWSGHDVLWYLIASIIGFLITYALSRKLKPTIVLIIGIVFLLVGCIKSTYAPLLEKIVSVDIPDLLGSRNGLFYGFPYYALGLFIAKQDLARTYKNFWNFIGFGICLCLLFVESIVFTVIFKTDSTVLWMSVFPMTYYLFMILKHTNINLSYRCSLVIRKTSALVYFIHPFFLRAFSNLSYLVYFFIVSLASILVSLFVIYLSNKRFFKWLQILS